jgi:hypothetical protein
MIKHNCFNLSFVMQNINLFLFLIIIVFCSFTIFVFQGYAFALSISISPSGRDILPGGEHAVFSFISGSENTNVAWSASGGCITPKAGSALWVAPKTAGKYLITCTSEADSHQSTSITMNVIPPQRVDIKNMPWQATVFKNQPITIQAVIFGTTNTDVEWRCSDGRILGPGREVIFTAKTTGTYYITSISKADTSCIATTKVVVADHEWPGISLNNKTLPVVPFASGSGRVYNVRNEADFDSTPWNKLAAGDTVKIFPGVYHKQILISTSGTHDQPIRICGVSDESGRLPELSGENATAVPGSRFGSGIANLQQFGGIIIFKDGSPWYGGSSSYPQNIIIEGLHISGYNNNNTFRSIDTGSNNLFHKGAAGVRIQHGSDITIRGCEIVNNGNGIFTMANNGVESHNTRRVLVEGNYFKDNGVQNSYLEHQSYLQVFGLVVQGNYYDHALLGALNSQVKTRAVQQFIRYNYFEPSSRILDLVPIQDNGPLVYPWEKLDPKDISNINHLDVVGTYEAYRDQFIYGNIFHNQGKLTTAWLVHGASEWDQSVNFGGTLYFYYNTILISLSKSSTSNWRSGIIDFGPYYKAIDANSLWSLARLTNNAIYLERDMFSSSLFFWNRYRQDRVLIDRNWISTKWGDGSPRGGDGTGIAGGLGDLGATGSWQGGVTSTQVQGLENLISDSSIPFNRESYRPLAGSKLLDAAVPLIGKSASLPPLSYYDLQKHLMLPRESFNNIGAIELSD